jgi:hypothetical protein
MYFVTRYILVTCPTRAQFCTALGVTMSLGVLICLSGLYFGWFFYCIEQPLKLYNDEAYELHHAIYTANTSKAR